MDRRSAAPGDRAEHDDRPDEPTHRRPDLRAARDAQGFRDDVAHHRDSGHAAGRDLRPHQAGTLMRILSVVGARPNFMKLAPVDRELARRRDVEHVLVHTGQHYDPEKSDLFFEELWLPAPEYHLGVGSGSHAQQTAAVMQRLEPILTELRPDLVMVYGDVNSTLAAALVAAKLGRRVGHVEAGLRSGDWTMAEEVHRVVTDRFADLVLTPSRDAVDNLVAVGMDVDRRHL